MNDIRPGLDNFLKQFKGMDAVIAETRLFNLADEQVKGYNGGLWGEVKIGNLWVPVLPESSGDTVRVVVWSNYADETTDRVSAGAAYAIYIVSNIQNIHFSRGNFDVSDAYAELYHAYRDAIFADDSELDHKAIYRIID